VMVSSRRKRKRSNNNVVIGAGNIGESCDDVPSIHPHCNTADAIGHTSIGVVCDFLPTYLHAESQVRRKIERTVVLIIRHRGGRFLRQNDMDGRLYEIGDLDAQIKTQQTFFRTFYNKDEENREVISKNRKEYYKKNKDCPIFKARRHASQAKSELKYYLIHGEWRNSKAALLTLPLQSYVDEFRAPIMLFPGDDEDNNACYRDEVVEKLCIAVGQPKLISTLKSHAGKQGYIGLTLLLNAFADDGEGRFAVMDTEFFRGKGSSKGRTYDVCIAIFDFRGKLIDHRVWRAPENNIITDDEWKEIYAYIAKECKDMPLCCWGTPELQIFEEAGRGDGFDACEMLKTVFPQMRFASSKGIDGNKNMRFSCSMDFLTNVFGMRESAFHSAEMDCRGEAVVISAFIRYIAAFNELFDEDEY
jgi:hypothetical protein